MKIEKKTAAAFGAMALWFASPFIAVVANHSATPMGDSYPQDALGLKECEHQKPGYVRDLFCGQPLGPNGRRMTKTDPRSRSFYLTHKL